MEMKKQMTGGGAWFVLLVFCALASHAQVPADANKLTGKRHQRIDKVKVPDAVIKSFYTEYPTVTYQDWYDYPALGGSTDWYDYDPNWTYGHAENYAVEFALNEVPYTCVYSRAGKKLATHRAIFDLPAAVSAAISAGSYHDWHLGYDNEEIYKDKATDQLKVYKVNLTLGAQQRTLYVQSDGKVLKDQ